MKTEKKTISSHLCECEVWGQLFVSFSVSRGSKILESDVYLRKNIAEFLLCLSFLAEYSHRVGNYQEYVYASLTSTSRHTWKWQKFHYVSLFLCVWIFLLSEKRILFDFLRDFPFILQLFNSLSLSLSAEKSFEWNL